ncbi:MAG: FAD:protein FMN transferase [Chloroflexi bacterium]|nr:FAD:protein FMN transferase [Chloroflexota bacterium]
MNQKIDFKAMGCRMVAIVDSSAPLAPELYQQVPVWFEEWEAALSRFRPDSELNRLNRSAGWPFQVSETMWQVFQAAVDAENASDGLVRAAVLEALVAAGYDRSFDMISPERMSAPVGVWGAVGSLAEVSVDESTCTICLPVDMQLDFGGVAKGWAAQQASKRLAEYGAALVSAGGDVAISGERVSGELWPIAVENPFIKGEYLQTLMLGACGVATSGTDYRRWKQGGRWSHHIIDPRTGQPAVTDVVTATVIAPDALMAEMAAKTVLILGSMKGLEWLAERPAFSALLVLETGQVLLSNHMGNYFWRQHERKTS